MNLERPSRVGLAYFLHFSNAYFNGIEDKDKLKEELVKPSLPFLRLNIYYMTACHNSI